MTLDVRTITSYQRSKATRKFDKLVERAVISQKYVQNSPMDDSKLDMKDEAEVDDMDPFS